MDIGSRNKYPAGALSNFSPHPFIFDGVKCSSMEGLLQAFKFDKKHIQVEVCKLTGIAAKKRGSKRNWQTKQKLWWDEECYARNDDGYQDLLDRAYEALAKNEKFKKALLATNEATLTHSIGKRKKSLTVLTEREFCNRLMKLRNKLQRMSK
jgi:predicted NAD-dependent protein-ADP-ribosyltransferase YbiA (DUF1768 family)